MKNLHESGKIYFFRTQVSDTPSEAFGPLLEVNSNFDILKSLHICGSKALGITSNNELLEWEFNPKQKNIFSSIPNPQSSTYSPKSKFSKKKDFYFLLFKPSYHFHKIKFLQISLNKTMCLGLDSYHNVLVWGENKEGLLGLGYDITSVETPTIIPKLKEIKEVSLSDYHAIALNTNGNAYSWGLGKYGELGLERSIYTPTPLPILSDTLYSKVFCGNLVTCFLDNNGKFYYYGIVIKQLGGYGNISTLKSLLSDQSYNDGKNIYFEKEIEELENECFKNIVIGNGFVALLTKNGLLYVLEYNNKLSLLHSKFFLYNITVAYNEIYGLARERPKKDKKIKDNYYLFKWSSKSSSENELSSDTWQTTIWKFKEDFQLISNCKLLNTNNNKSILLLKDQDEKYNLTNSIFNPHRKNLDFSGQNNDMTPLDKSVNNINMSSFGDSAINKKILPEKFLEYFNQYDDSFNIKYKKCKLKLNKRTGMDNSSFYTNNNNKSRTLFLKNSQNNNITGNNKYSGSLSPYLEHNISHNNNLFSESYNAQFDLGKENDNVNIYKPDDEDDIIDAKEKELNKYRNEVDNIINNFKTKKESNNNSINTTNKNQILYSSQKNNNKNRSQNNSNQNERYSSNRNENDDDLYGNKFFRLNPGGDNFTGKNKFKLSKEEMINLMKMDKKLKERENNSNYNDSLSKVRNNIINIKDKIKFKDNTLNKINNLFTLNEEESEEDFEEKDGNDNSEDDINNGSKINDKNKLKKKRKNNFKRFPSFSKLSSKSHKKKNNILNAIIDNNSNKTDSEDTFLNIDELNNIYKRKRYYSKDNIFLKNQNDEYNKKYINDYENNLGFEYISENDSENNNLNVNQKKKGLIKQKDDENNNQGKGKTLLKSTKNSKKRNENDDNEEEDDNENDDNNNINKSQKQKMELINKKRIIKNKNNHKSLNQKNNEKEQNDTEDNEISENNKENLNFYENNEIKMNKKSKNKKRDDANKNKLENENEYFDEEENSDSKINNDNNLKKSESKSNNKNKNSDKNKKNKLNKKNENNEENGFEEEEEEDDEEIDGIEFFEEINKDNNNIRKIKNIKGNKKIKIKKTNSISNISNLHLGKLSNPKVFKLLDDSDQEINNNIKSKKISNSLDKIDKRKSISNLLDIPNRIYNKTLKSKKKIRNKKTLKNIREDESNENNEEQEEDSDNNDNDNNNKRIKNNKKKNNYKNNHQNKNNYMENSGNEDEINNYDEDNNEITFNKKIKNNKNKIINKKGALNTGKENRKNNLIKNNTNYNDSDFNDSVTESDNNNNKKNKNELIKKKHYKENSKQNNDNINNNNNKIHYMKMQLNGIKINKFSLMYFCELVDHYMKKKSFGICAKQIAKYQKYLEIKFSLKILFRVLLKRIIFYKIKFMHRYKKINKYLIKNKIKNIKLIYKKNK